jgi:sorbitol-specific phosphotransferase system component IIC
MLFAEGHPFKKEFWTNKLYVLNCLILFVYMWIQAGVKKARFPELELYGDVMTEDEQGNDIPEAQGEIPSSWLVGLVPWAVLLLITMALFEVIVVKRFIRKLH